jgi:hypothetical protein
MARSPRDIRNLLVALYAWFVSAFFGAVLIDVAYARLLRGVSAAVLQPVYRGVSDFLLILGAFSVVAALAAITVSLSVRPAAYLLTASVLLLGSEFLVPIFLFPMLRTSPDATIPAIVPALRLLPIALASLLALAALRASFRQPVGPRRP